MQKGVFYTSKGHLLQCKRASFTSQKSTFQFAIVNSFYKEGYISLILNKHDVWWGYIQFSI